MKMADSQLSWVRRLIAALLVPACVASLPAAEAWPPAEYAQKLKAEPKTDVDKAIKEMIVEYEARIAKLKPGDSAVKANLPRLRHKLVPFYLEYNQPKKRYRRDHFSPGECMNRFKTDMKHQFAALEAGKDPAAASAGRWQTRVAWVDAQTSWATTT